MIENIAKVLDRGEKLDLLVDKTELLQVGAGRGGEGGGWVGWPSGRVWVSGRLALPPP
jgi:hypothetical protein